MSRKGKRWNERTLLRNFETVRRTKESVIVFVKYIRQKEAMIRTAETMKSVLPQPAFCGYFLVNSIGGYMQRYSVMEDSIKVHEGLGMWESVKACPNDRKCGSIVSRTDE